MAQAHVQPSAKTLELFLRWMNQPDVQAALHADLDLLKLNTWTITDSALAGLSKSELNVYMSVHDYIIMYVSMHASEFIFFTLSYGPLIRSLIIGGVSFDNVLLHNPHRALSQIHPSFCGPSPPTPRLLLGRKWCDVALQTS